MSCRSPLAAPIAATLVLTASVANAGHPMLSEDTGTQGRGNMELELGDAWTDPRAGRSFFFQPQLSYGASATLDLIAQPSWQIIDRPDGGSSSRGFGDTNLDAKWRLYGAAPWSFGIRAGVQLPTAENDEGLPNGRISPHATLVETVDLAPFVFDANLGYARAPATAGARANLYHFSAAATVAFSERLSAVLDTAVDSDPDATRATDPVVALVGVIYTARPGLDLDIGYRAPLNSAAPSQQWLFGITYRGAP